MKIGIDIRTLETGHRFRGIGIYSQNLISEISQIDSQNNYVFFTQKNSQKIDFIDAKSFQYQNYLIRKNADPTKYHWLLDQIYFSAAIGKSKVQMVHILDQLSCPLIKSAKTVVTVHDLIQVTGYHKTNIKNKIKLFPVKQADKIIAISQAVKNDLIKVLKIPPQKIKVIYNGYNQKIFIPNKARKINLFRKKLLESEARYFLYIGSFGQFEPRKNINFLIDVFCQFCREEKNKNFFLVLVGVLGSEFARIMRKFKENGLAQKVIFTGHVKHEDLAIYFQAAEIFLFPSLCEGFGLPPLEAMACATPVISSNKTSLPEVVGHGGILLDPQDNDKWISSMKNLIENNSLRNNIIKKGLVQAKKFSWKKCAKETIKTYEEIANTQN